MKHQKLKENKSKGLAKNTDNIWKKKSKSKSVVIKRQNRRIIELENSRNLWKNKYQNRADRAVDFVDFGTKKAKHHQYPLLVVLWIFQLQNYGKMSLRSCRHCVVSLYLIWGLEGRVPSHGTVRNWLCKQGCYRLKNAGVGDEKRVIYVDESIVLGGEKIVLILGIKQEQIPKDRCVKHEDMEVLHVSSAKEWKAEDIADILEKIDKKGIISYVVSDQGTILKKAYEICNYTHIEDCTHIFANFLKRIYEKDSTFESFRKLIGELRKKWFLSKEKSSFMPPSMRGKLRFANIFPCIDWAKKHIDNWENIDESITKSLVFLKENQGFVEELVEVEKIFKSVCSRLKNEGFGKVQKLAILKELPTESKFKNVLVVSQNITDYLGNLTQKSQQLGEDFLLCSSDIIESFFGKFNRSGEPPKNKHQ